MASTMEVKEELAFLVLSGSSPTELGCDTDYISIPHISDETYYLRPAQSVTDKAGHFVTTSFSHSFTHSCKKLLQTAVTQLLQWYRMKVFLLPHLQFAEALSGQIQFDVRKFIQ